MVKLRCWSRLVLARGILFIIDRILKEQQIPSDFKYLALAESGLQNVVSPAGAAGFWQFLDKTGKRYGLEVSEELDERYHLEKATYAACLYFKEAYGQLKDWSLVAASYNMGIEGVKKQIYFSNPDVEQNNAILDELESFADAINTDSTPVVTLEQATEALRVAYQIIDCFKK